MAAQIIVISHRYLVYYFHAKATEEVTAPKGLDPQILFGFERDGLEPEWQGHSIERQGHSVEGPSILSKLRYPC
jgi:hypothetical protein